MPRTPHLQITKFIQESVSIGGVLTNKGGRQTRRLAVMNNFEACSCMNLTNWTTPEHTSKGIPLSRTAPLIKYNLCVQRHRGCPVIQHSWWVRSLWKNTRPIPVATAPEYHLFRTSISSRFNIQREQLQKILDLASRPNLQRQQPQITNLPCYQLVTSVGGLRCL